MDFRKMLANFFKAIAVSLASCITSWMLFYSALPNLRAATRISSFGVFWGTLILCGKNLTTHSALDLGT